MVLCVVVWSGVVCSCMEWCCVEFYGVVWSGGEWCGVVWSAVEWCCMELYEVLSGMM